MTTTPVTIEQAAAILGVSASTIRRRIRAGALQVTEARRPQGVVWLVHLPAGTGPASVTDTVDTASVTTTASASQPPGEAMASLIQATLTPIIAPLVAELAANRQRIERQSDRVAELERENGQFSAQLVAAQEQVSKLFSERDELKALLWKTEISTAAPEASQQPNGATLDAPTAMQAPEPSTEPEPEPGPEPLPPLEPFTEPNPPGVNGAAPLPTEPPRWRSWGLYGVVGLVVVVIVTIVLAAYLSR